MLFLTFSWQKLVFVLFINNHKPKIYNIFGLLSQRNNSYEATYLKLSTVLVKVKLETEREGI